MGDDEDSITGGRRRQAKGRQMTSDDRAIAGVERRRQEKRRDYSGGIALPDNDSFPLDEITEPERVLGQEPSEAAIDMLRSLGISPDAPATMQVIAQVLVRAKRKSVEHNSGLKEFGDQLKEMRRLLQTPPNALTAELRDRVEDLERDAKTSRLLVKRLKGLAWAAVLGAVGSIGTAAVKLYDSARESGEAEIRLIHVERGLERIERAVDRIRLAPDRTQPKE